MSGDQTGDEQDQGRADAAALRRDCQRDGGKLKTEPGPEERHPGERKEPRRDLGGGVLESVLHPFHQRRWQGCHEDEEGRRKGETRHEALPQDPDREGIRRGDQRQDAERQGPVFRMWVSAMSQQREDQQHQRQPAEQRRDSGRRSAPLVQQRAVLPTEKEGDQRHDQNVGREAVARSEAGPSDQKRRSGDKDHEERQQELGGPASPFRYFRTRGSMRGFLHAMWG
jgi:hypothetical protein